MSISIRNLLPGVCALDPDGDVWVRCVRGAYCINPREPSADGPIFYDEYELVECGEAVAGPFALIGALPPLPRREEKDEEE